MAAVLKGSSSSMHHGTMSPERRRKATTLLPAEHHRSSARLTSHPQQHLLSPSGLQAAQAGLSVRGGPAGSVSGAAPQAPQQQTASGSGGSNECRPEAPCLKCRQACTCSWCEEQGNTCTNRQSCSMRGKQCATCNASECRGKRAKRLRAHLGITEVRRPGYASQANYHHALPRASYAPQEASSQSYALAAAQPVAPQQTGQAASNWGARAVFGDHKYPTIRTGAPSTRVQMDALMHKCTMAATTGRQWQRVSTRDPQLGTYACREDNNNNIRLELSGSVLSKLAGFVVVASVAAELGLDKIPDSSATQGAVVLTAGHNVDVEPWGAPDHHKALLLITVAGDTVVAVAKTDGTAHGAHHQQHPLPNLFRTNPAQSNCVFQLFYASRGDLVYVPPGASYQTRHIGNDHILLVVKVDPLSFTSLDANGAAVRHAGPVPVVQPSPVSYLAYPLGGAANHLAAAAAHQQQQHGAAAPPPADAPGGIPATAGINLAAVQQAAAARQALQRSPNAAAAAQQFAPAPAGL